MKSFRILLPATAAAIALAVPTFSQEGPLSNDPPKGLTSDQIEALTTTHVSVLTTKQLSGGLTTDQIVALTSAQVAVLQIIELLGQQPPASGLSLINPGSAKGLIAMSEDFDEPLADFEPYMK